MSFEQLDLFTESASDEIEKLDNLTERQKKTYYLIKMQSMLGKATTIREIVDNYSADRYDDGYVWNNNPKIHNPCSSVWNDINKMNEDADVSKIIIWNDNYEYKLAKNREEVKTFCKHLYWQRAMSKLKRYGNLMRKADRDGQCKLFTEQDSKQYWESFIQENISEFIKAMENEE